MKEIIRTKRKCQNLLKEIDSFIESLNKSKVVYEQLLEKIGKDNGIKTIEKRITQQQHLHYETFTNREKEILSMLAHGLTLEEIAEDCFISMATVRTHLTHMYDKSCIAGINNRHNKTKQIRLILYYLKQIGALDYDWTIRI